MNTTLCYVPIQCIGTQHSVALTHRNDFKFVWSKILSYGKQFLQSKILSHGKELRKSNSRYCEIVKVRAFHNENLFPKNRSYMQVISVIFRLEAVQQCVTLLEEFSLLYRTLPSYKTIFSPVIHLCKKLPTEHYPESFEVRVIFMILT